MAEDGQDRVFAGLKLGGRDLRTRSKPFQVETGRENALSASDRDGRLIARTFAQRVDQRVEFFLVERVYLAVIHCDDVCTVGLFDCDHFWLRSAIAISVWLSRIAKRSMVFLSMPLRRATATERENLQSARSVKTICRLQRS